MAEGDLPPDIFNSRYFGRQSSPATGADLKFPLFARLPRELRLQIWTWHLPQRRFLRVLLEEGVGTQHGGSESGYELTVDDDDEWASLFAAGPSESETETETFKLPPASPTAPLLRVIFLGDPSPAMPALQLVCREAREAHNSVYRIRLPALARIPRGWDYKTTRIVAYLNPELDILSLQTSNPPEIVRLNLLPFFLHHLLQHDFSPGPLRFGARHLCVDLRHLGSDHLYGADDEGGPAPLTPDILASVRLTVSHLRGLYLRFTTGHLEPRVMSGPLLPRHSGLLLGFPGAVEPVAGGDPRLACPEGRADLRQVWIRDQLRPSLDVWAGLERAWGVPPAGDGSARTRIMRAMVGLEAEGLENCGGRDIRSPGAYLCKERAAWQKLMDPASDLGILLRPLFQGAQKNFVQSSPNPPAVLAPEEWISQRQPHTAVGFWLIDPEVLEAAVTTGAFGKKIVNLSARVRPEDIELWVFRGH